MDTKISINGRIRSVLTKYVEGEDRVDVPGVMPMLVEELGEDREFLAQFLSAALYPYAIMVVRQIMAEGRPGRQRVMEAGGVVQTEANFNEEAKNVVRPFDWNAWWIKADRYIRLPEMNRADLLLSIELDSKRVRTERISIRFRAKLVELLPEDPEVTVEDVVDDEMKAALYEEAVTEIDKEDS